MPATFDQSGLHFIYPDNWEVTGPDLQSGCLSVSVNSPSTAFWSLSRFPQQSDSGQVVEEMLAAMRQEYPAIEVDEVTSEIDGHPMVGYDLNFFYLDLCNSAQIRTFSIGSDSYVLMSQAEDREMDENERVFEAMTISLLRNLREGAAGG